MAISEKPDYQWIIESKKGGISYKLHSNGEEKVLSQNSGMLSGVLTEKSKDIWELQLNIRYLP
jgi:hypothetical protein